MMDQDAIAPEASVITRARPTSQRLRKARGLEVSTMRAMRPITMEGPSVGVGGLRGVQSNDQQ